MRGDRESRQLESEPGLRAPIPDPGSCVSLLYRRHRGRRTRSRSGSNVEGTRAGALGSASTWKRSRVTSTWWTARAWMPHDPALRKRFDPPVHDHVNGNPGGWSVHHRVVAHVEGLSRARKETSIIRIAILDFRAGPRPGKRQAVGVAIDGLEPHRETARWSRRWCLR